MGAVASDYVSQIEKSQRTMEYVLAVIIPGLLALMLFSYFIFSGLVNIFFGLTVVVAALMVLPAKKVQDLHYLCWSKNTMPLKMITSMIGMVYVSTASVFAVSLISASKGLRWDQPATFVIIVVFLTMLLALMAYSYQNKEHFMRTDKRYFKRSASEIESAIKAFLDERGERYVRTNGKGAKFELKTRGLFISVLPIGASGTQILVEPREKAEDPINIDIKIVLDGLA